MAHLCRKHNFSYLAKCCLLGTHHSAINTNQRCSLECGLQGAGVFSFLLSTLFSIWETSGHRRCCQARLCRMNPHTLMMNFPILIRSRKLKSGMKALVLCQGQQQQQKGRGSLGTALWKPWVNCMHEINSDWWRGRSLEGWIGVH